MHQNVKPTADFCCRVWILSRLIKGEHWYRSGFAVNISIQRLNIVRHAFTDGLSMCPSPHIHASAAKVMSLRSVKTQTQGKLNLAF